MSNNDWKSRLGVVFSTDPSYQYSEEQDVAEEQVAPQQQDLRVWLDRKHRGGKVATLVKGFRGPESELKELAKILKSRCGVGGAVKDGEIIIQGDHRDKVIELLAKSGFRSKKAGG
ncbi:MAG: translation initiation factor [Rikenellaceae bacterium]